MASKSKFEDLDLSQDEIKRLGDALKDEKFRKMFVEYAQEISDPENRKRYEEEIAQLENERGMNVNFVHPHAGYVLKTSINGDTKAFINICKNDKIGKPSAQRKSGPDGRTGVQWSIPHSFAPPREDMDESGKKCKIFDVVFHPDTYRMAETNERFRKLVDDTAVDGIEGQFSMKIDKKNIKRPNIKYKGMPTATVIRSRQTADGDAEMTNLPVDSDSPLQNFPYPYGNKTSEELAKEKAKEMKTKERENKNKVKSVKDENAPTEPKYVLTHRTEMDMQEYTNSPDSRPSTRPKSLVLAIDLPLLNSAASVSLDIFEKRVLLESVKPAAYRLDLNLPYPVDDGSGSAIFDKGKHRLTVTLPVLPPDLPALPTYIEDSKCADGASETLNLDYSDGNGLDGNSKPLIEVLSSTVTYDTTSVPMDTNADNINETKGGNETDRNNINETNGGTKNIWNEDDNGPSSTATITYNSPNFSHRQDNETVSFVLDVKNVKFDTVTKLFPKSNAFHVRFVSVGSGCFPQHYSFYLTFPENCLVVPDHCSVDVSEKNVVLLVLKSHEVRGLWDKFWVGVDENHLQEKLFATEANLELELSLLEKEAVANEKMVQSQGQLDGDASEVKVTEMSEKILRINLSKAKKGKVPVPAEEEEDLQEDDLNSPDIQVIQEKNDRHLHGILKQRSRSHSESSDDIPSGCSYSRENSTSSGSHMSESPISESEEADLSLESRLRKSVSFNEHVDKTTFKPTATVCSMKTALKSKRRRNRKREDKKRRRHNSNGSEYSSSDEHPHHHSDTEVQEQEDTEEHDKVEGKADWEDGVPADKPCDKSKARSGQQDETVASLAEAYRTSPSGESVEKEPLPNEGSFHSSKAVHVQDLIPEQCNSVCGVEKSAPANDEKGHDDAQDLEPHDTEREPVPDENERTKHLKSSAGELCSGDANVCDDAPESGTNAVTVAGEKHLEESSSGQAADSVQTPKGVSSETMLRWTDQNATACSDHKTQCAFSFSNSVMFDLDVD